MLMSAELKGCVTWFIYFLDLPWIRYDCAKFYHCRICVTDFRDWGPFCPPPSVSSPEKAHPKWGSMLKLQIKHTNIYKHYKYISDFKSTYNLKDLVKQKTYFKNTENWCIDLILTKSPQSFKKSSVFELGLSDFHTLTTTFQKHYFPNPKPKIINYKD